MLIFSAAYSALCQNKSVVSRLLRIPGGCRTLIPISVGQRSDSYQTVFRADVGQFWAPLEWCPTETGIRGRKEWSDAGMGVRVAVRFR